MAHSDRIRAAWAAIDAANASDPTLVTVRGETGPKEILHAQLVTAWVERLQPEASDALLLAARGHHLRRWTVPRNSYPAGRAGYLRWRKALHEQHATELATLARDAGFDDGTIATTQALVRKDGLNQAPAGSDVQVLEDALCLVFLETQFSDIAARLEPATLSGVIVKTVNKMSADGTACITELPLGPGAQRLITEAFARDVVQHYLDALAAHDWGALAATLAADVERIGPYGDVYRGREEYGTFLRDTVSALAGYELVVVRMIADGSAVAVELHETVDDGPGRLRTDESVVFDVGQRQIVRVAVYLRTSVSLEKRD